MKLKQPSTLAVARKIQVYGQTLDVYNDGNVFVDGNKLVLELCFDHHEMDDQELTDHLETALYYDYQDNKE